eukprot:gnl/TRDRNA2_/TRDRNA2_80285_c0_seq1.p1 gnl/TRDRNA2_/TRDRNA2_80285_c0~~gnl/TRDRNA2_/TRDRNA2_80285_c0_seq1.p1  ORF type:complete len:438 (-),score=71.41 gnl/TRDRNA2_/TRDRNA2_80285_c0_seq1:273-1586(-)
MRRQGSTDLNGVTVEFDAAAPELPSSRRDDGAGEVSGIRASNLNGWQKKVHEIMGTQRLVQHSMNQMQVQLSSLRAEMTALQEAMHAELHGLQYGLLHELEQTRRQLFALDGTSYNADAYNAGSFREFKAMMLSNEDASRDGTSKLSRQGSGSEMTASSARIRSDAILKLSRIERGSEVPDEFGALQLSQVETGSEAPTASTYSVPERPALRRDQRSRSFQDSSEADIASGESLKAPTASTYSVPERPALRRDQRSRSFQDSSEADIASGESLKAAEPVLQRQASAAEITLALQSAAPRGPHAGRSPPRHLAHHADYGRAIPGPGEYFIPDEDDAAWANNSKSRGRSVGIRAPHAAKGSSPTPSGVGVTYGTASTQRVFHHTGSADYAPQAHAAPEPDSHAGHRAARVAEMRAKRHGQSPQVSPRGPAAATYGSRNA